MKFMQSCDISKIQKNTKILFASNFIDKMIKILIQLISFIYIAMTKQVDIM